MTRLPASAISVAATRPARPPPTTITFASSAIAPVPRPETIEARGVIGGQWQMVVRNRQGTAREVLLRFQFGTCCAKVQACNTRLEFDSCRLFWLDKIPIWQHAGSASPKIIRSGSTGWTGAGI